MKSILQSDKVCYRCGKNGYGDPLDKHHAFGGALRGKAERYGLWVYLCHCACHEFGPESVHQDRESRLEVQQAAQRAAMREYGWTTEDFIREFGRNYI